MNRDDLLRFARAGAEARLLELQREIDAIYQRFPDLRSRRSVEPRNPYTAGVKSAVAGVRGAVEGAVTRRRRGRLSAAGRRRISEAQIARWARQKEKKGTVESHRNKSRSTPKARGSRKKR